MSRIKIPTTQYPILDIFKSRWSARSFSAQAISEHDMNTILEAASWAASAMNEQPWRYWIAKKGTHSFSKVCDSLMPGNQPWAKNADALVISLASLFYQRDGSPNAYAHHDVGLANAHLLLQANALGIYSHPMAGFKKEVLIQELEIPESLDPVIVIALGYLDTADKLEEPFQTRENTARTRNPLIDTTKVLI